MNPLEMATINELVDELTRRSSMLFLYHEFESERGPQYHIRETGDKLRLVGVLQARVIPELCRRIRESDEAEVESEADEDEET